MKTTIKSQTKGKLIMEIEFDLEGSMLEMEEKIQRVLNDAGSVATGKALEKFDTDGSPISIGNKNLSTKGKQKKTLKRRMDE